jgi:colanic acid biosynthesis glycosyl transferase WcaI
MMTVEGPMTYPDLATKRVLIYGMNYAPELAGVGRYTGDIAEHLAASGAEVTVVTTPAHYPGWRVQKPYQNGRFSHEIHNKVHIYRCPLVLRQKMHGAWRILAPLSFALSSAPVAFWQIIRRRPDIVLAIEPTLFAAPIALLAAKIAGARTVLHVQDLEVDAAFAVGHISERRSLRRIGRMFERRVLRHFNQVITISSRMAERLAGKGVSSSRIAVVRNWVDLDHITPLGGKSPYRAELGYSANDFIVLYSGNIGAKQGLDVLLDAASRLRAHKRIHFLIAGEGPAKANLVAKYGHLPSVRFLPLQPYDRLSEFLGLADLHALPQEADAADLVLPSKLGGMLASGRSIVAMAARGTELANFLANAATLIEPGNAPLLADAILAKATQAVPDEEEARHRGLLASHLSRTRGLASFKSCLVSEGFPSGFETNTIGATSDAATIVGV